MIHLTIVIPVFNSELTIGRVVDEIVSLLSKKYLLEIILVNDASQDNSDEVCQALHQKYQDKINYFSLAKNVGEHAAIIAGLNHTSGDYTVIMSDDFQNPVSEVDKLVQAILDQKKDVIYADFETKNHSFLRNLGSKLNNRMACWMLNKPKNLYLSSFKVLNKFIVEQIIKYDLPFPYIDGLILRTTDSIGSVKVAHHERQSGQSGYTFSKLLSLWSNMFLNFSLIPLRFVIFVGFVTAFLAFVLGIYTIVKKIMNPDIVAGYTTIVLAISFFSGLILIGIGMLGEYIGRVFLSQSKKPQFTIRKKFLKKEN